MPSHAENRAAWVAALRSGDYEQTQGQLGYQYSDGDVEYCCLGVACELAYSANVLMARVVSEAGTISYDYSATVLPPSVQKWLGLASRSGELRVGKKGILGDLDTLSELNDRGKYDFAMIANVLESGDVIVYD